jgi:hypothetical protein
MKPLKETKLGQWLKEKAPKIGNIVGDVLPDKGVLGIVKNLISSEDVSPEVRAEFLKLEYEFEKEIFELEVQDRSNARDMQKAALAQSDIFSKRYVYYFSTFWSIFATAYLAGVTFLDIPEKNTRVVDTVLGFLLGTAIAGMFAWFYGSSMNSKARNDQMYSAITDKLKEKN